jgi:hypothetical protein
LYVKFGKQRSAASIPALVPPWHDCRRKTLQGLQQAGDLAGHPAAAQTRFDTVAAALRSPANLKTLLF